MTETPRFKLPLLSASQAQKHVTHNEALLLLDLLVGVIPVTSRALTAPGGAEPDGTVMILGGAGTGAWAGFEAFQLALKIDGSWRRVLPGVAMVAAVAAEDGKLVWFDGAAWTDVSLGAGAAGPVVFPAAAVPVADPNTLDDYEEGVWTPGLTLGGVTTGITYGANNAGRYTKIGRQVTATCFLHLTSKGSATGAVQLTGLPFAAAAGPVLGVLAVGWASGIIGVSGTIQGTVTAGGQTISLYAAGGGAASALSNVHMSNSSQMAGMVVYDAA